jgi:small-conductance mechanosensitive channel
MTAFSVIAGTIGIGIGLGLQGIANNFISGIHYCPVNFSVIL